MLVNLVAMVESPGWRRRDHSMASGFARATAGGRLWKACGPERASRAFRHGKEARGRRRKARG